jgi:gephyrin
MFAHLLLTTGGTGFAPRDVTPEAVGQLLERHASGLLFAIMQASTAATPMGALARPVAGTRRRTLIITLPGSPKAVPEILGPIMPLLPHAVKLLQNKDDAHVRAK